VNELLVLDRALVADEVAALARLQAPLRASSL
jgi:hypothetical protein